MRGQREGLATATLSYIKKNVLHIVLPCLSFSLTLSVVLSPSLSFPMSWSFYSLKRYREGEGGGVRRGEGIEGWTEGGRVVLSSPLRLSSASRTKNTKSSASVCVCVCVRPAKKRENINNHARGFTVSGQESFKYFSIWK